MFKYLGSKKKILTEILKESRSLCGRQTFDMLDLFSGTARVGHMFKANGCSVISNDHNSYAYTNAICYVQSDAERHAKDAERLISELNRTTPTPGFITDTYCIKSRFFQPKNGEKIDAIRDKINTLDISLELKSILLVSLIEAADRVDSTTGVQMAYLKSWAKRSFNDLHLRLPQILPRAPQGASFAFQMDALECMKRLSSEVDMVYLDPPYNQHKYHSNYHIWETIVLWDSPEVYGKACKRLDGKTRGGGFYSKKTCKLSFESLVKACSSDFIVVSFNNEGFLDKQDILSVLQERFETRVVELDFKRYIGHNIGKHSSSGERLGDSSHSSCIEYLFVGEKKM